MSYNGKAHNLKEIGRAPNGITANELRLEPTWDPLRQNPRFEQLLAKGLLCLP